MSLKKVEQVKKGGFFKVRDLVVYGAVILLIVALFLAMFFTSDKNPLKGVRISLFSSTVYEYNFESSTGTVYDGGRVEILSDDASAVTVKVTCSSGYNVVKIDKNARTAKVTEADCRTKWCVEMDEINNNSMFIYCPDHDFFKVEPFDGGVDVIM